MLEMYLDDEHYSGPQRRDLFNDKRLPTDLVNAFLSVLPANRLRTVLHNTWMPQILDAWAEHADVHVRRTVATNPDTELGTLRGMVHDADLHVRIHVFHHPRVDDPTRRVLTEDLTDPIAREMLAYLLAGQRACDGSACLGEMDTSPWEADEEDHARAHFRAKIGYHVPTSRALTSERRRDDGVARTALDLLRNVLGARELSEIAE